MLSFEEVKSSLEHAGQSHILQFWPELSGDDKSTFLVELSQLDLHELREHCELAAESAKAGHSATAADQEIEPVSSEFIGSIRKSDQTALTGWENEGFLQISQNRVAVLLLAGGQGTRLGVPYPKGMYNVGLPSSKTLYQIQAERIRKIQELANAKHGSKCTVAWYIMTSEFTLDPTKKFFQENKYFGLDPSDVVMFEQRMIPAVTFDGKVLEDMEKRGVEYLHIYCVDNILVKMADPIFIGFCVSKGADCGAKVVEKTYPAEPVGVVCKVKGVYQVVEYSELRPETAEQRDPGGELVYSAGNICNHFFTRTFLNEVAQKFQGQLKQHVALKKVPFVDREGNLVKPTKPNGIKMEKKFVAFEVLREEEFSPLKNADGAPLDTPTTARRSLLAQHYRWAMAAGASFLDAQGKALTPRPRDEDPPAVCEISPLVSFFGEGLEQLLGQKALTTPFLLDEDRAKELLQAQ
ncbi:unnamed protein product [Coregonus sp. 'balchen']|nr:unnamed protein product [Coregonus sp. 'balchen']